MRYGSVCSGIEAATRAWHPLGWTPAFFSEIDKFPSAVLAHHYGSNMPGDQITGNGVPNYGDMTEFERWPDHAIDVLVGGTPCQDYSVAGLRAGMAGDRGSLTLTYIQIAARYRPDWFVWENVPGVLSSNEGRDFARFLGDISGTKIDVPPEGWKSGGLVCGIPDAYGIAYRVLDTQFVRVDGFGRAIPQRRRRVFVVGYLGDWRRAAAVLFEPESVFRHSEPRRQAGKGFAADVAPSLRGCGPGAERTGDTRGQDPVITQPIAVDDVAGAMIYGQHGGVDTQTAFTGYIQPVKLPQEGQTPLPIAFNSREDPEVTYDRSGPLGASSPQAMAFAQNQRGEFRTSDVVPSLGAGGGKPGEGYPAVAFKPSHYTRGKDGAPSDVMPPLSADADKGDQDPVVLTKAYDMRGRDGGAQFEGPHDTAAIRAASGGSSRSYIQEKWAVRRLTPVECHRLQGFPDDFCRIPWRGKPADQCPDGPQYKALGNSMSVNVMRWIGQRIQMISDLCEAEKL